MRKEKKEEKGDKEEGKKEIVEKVDRQVRTLHPSTMGSPT